MEVFALFGDHFQLMGRREVGNNLQFEHGWHLPFWLR
jgi:hypothetical protein